MGREAGCHLVGGRRALVGTGQLWGRQTPQAAPRRTLLAVIRRCDSAAAALILCLIPVWLPWSLFLRKGAFCNSLGKE